MTDKSSRPKEREGNAQKPLLSDFGPRSDSATESRHCRAAGGAALSTPTSAFELHRSAAQDFPTSSDLEEVHTSHDLAVNHPDLSKAGRQVHEWLST